MKKNRSFTLIELVITMLIIGILAGVGSSIIVSVVQDLMYAPKNLNMDMLAQDAMEKIIGGDSNLAHGLRFSKQITAIAANSITFIDQDGKTVVVTLNTGTNKLTRTINAVADNTFLYYSAPADIGFFVGRNAAVFLYYDSAGSVTAIAANVRRVGVNFIARTGTGNFSDWQGKAEISSSIRTSKFQ
jgi:prepilin-type N-terminal cleavage/methylation domain-containing protein